MKVARVKGLLIGIVLKQGNINHSFFITRPNCNSPVMRQKGESENRCFKKTKHAKFSEKRTFLTL